MNFDINYILVPLLCLTGFILLVDLALNTRQKAKNQQANKAKGKSKDQARAGANNTAQQEVTWWLDYSRSLFPIILLVTIVRSFILEPYQIPSSSMLPTLTRGDFILVNKYTYGLRLPLSNYELLAFSTPERGDVIVFNFPHNPRIRYIKRVVGVPGDSLSYVDKQLIINGVPVQHSLLESQASYDDLLEQQPGGGRNYQIRHYLDIGSEDLARSDWRVPQGYYFVMGDNRDNSNDSRYWGFVPHSYLLGRASYIWMNWNGWTQLPSFSRNGGIN